jgi:hypothetical protein
MMFSLPSYADWTITEINLSGDSFYVDFERIRKNGGHVYFWQLTDFSEPKSKGGLLSSKVYYKADCELFSYKYLNDIYYNGPMGNGTILKSSDKPDEEWSYPPPKSTIETILTMVCGYSKNL